MNDGANRVRLGIIALDRDAAQTGERKTFARSQDTFALSVPPTLQSGESAFNLIKQFI